MRHTLLSCTNFFVQWESFKKYHYILLIQTKCKFSPQLLVQTLQYQSRQNPTSVCTQNKCTDRQTWDPHYAFISCNLWEWMRWEQGEKYCTYNKKLCSLTITWIGPWWRMCVTMLNNMTYNEQSTPSCHQKDLKKRYEMHLLYP